VIDRKLGLSAEVGFDNLV